MFKITVLGPYSPIDGTDPVSAHLRLLAELAEDRLEECAAAKASTERIAQDLRLKSNVPEPVA